MNRLKALILGLLITTGCAATQIDNTARRDRLEDIQAERFLSQAIQEGEIAQMSLMGYETMTKHCQEIIQRWPGSVYAQQAEKLLAEKDRAWRLEQIKKNRTLIFEQAEKRSNKKSAAQKRRDDFFADDANAGISEQTENCILQGKIHMGMTSEQVIASWGKPSDVNKTVGEWGVYEQWVYGENYLYIENGIVTSWQSQEKN